MKFIRKALLLGVGVAAASSSAMAAFSFNNGDIILGFQATGGLGADKNVFFNLGSSTGLRDSGATQGLLGNISTSLTSAFGSNWYSRSDVFFGAVGNLNNQAPDVTIPLADGFGLRAPVNGDPSRTFYVSAAAATVGAGAIIAANTYTSDALGSAGTNFSGMEAILPGLTTQGDGAAILTQGSQPVQWNNSWTVWNPTPGAAFNIFTGGIQQNLGQVDSTTYADVQRVLATNVGASPTGVVGGGTYEFTVAIGSNGSVSVIPEASTTMLLGLFGIAAAFQRRRSKLA